MIQKPTPSQTSLEDDNLFEEEEDYGLALDYLENELGQYPEEGISLDVED